jgi:uncharacterized damage-inducible protein DinB
MEVLMTPTASTTLPEVEVFRANARTTNQIIQRNLEGISQTESLVQPQPAGNCINWVAGHLLWVYDQALAMLNHEPVLGVDALQRYARGTPALTNTAEAMELSELVKKIDVAVSRLDVAFDGVTEAELNAKAPFSPTNNPDETVRSLLGLVTFHQAYHAGQLGVLRRIAGKSGAIA